MTCHTIASCTQMQQSFYKCPRDSNSFYPQIISSLLPCLCYATQSWITALVLVNMMKTRAILVFTLFSGFYRHLCLTEPMAKSLFSCLSLVQQPTSQRDHGKWTLRLFSFLNMAFLANGKSVSRAWETQVRREKHNRIFWSLTLFLPLRWDFLQADIYQRDRNRERGRESTIVN